MTDRRIFLLWLTPDPPQFQAHETVLERGSQVTLGYNIQQGNLLADVYSCHSIQINVKHY
jgi:hypothetical protein